MTSLVDVIFSGFSGLLLITAESAVRQAPHKATA